MAPGPGHHSDNLDINLQEDSHAYGKYIFLNE